PAIACSACPKPFAGYATVGLYAATDATVSSAAIAACALAPTNAMCGRSTGMCELMAAAADRSRDASAPVFGVLNAKLAAFGIDATAMPAYCSACGVSPL